MEKQPPKHPNVLEEIRRCIQRGAFKETGHAQTRMWERSITRLEVQEVLLAGQRNSKRDRFCRKLDSWAYVIEGETLDARLLRISAALHPEFGVLVVTAYERE